MHVLVTRAEQEAEEINLVDGQSRISRYILRISFSKFLPRLAGVHKFVPHPPSPSSRVDDSSKPESTTSSCLKCYPLLKKPHTATEPPSAVNTYQIPPAASFPSVPVFPNPLRLCQTCPHLHRNKSSMATSIQISITYSHLK